MRRIGAPVNDAYRERTVLPKGADCLLDSGSGKGGHFIAVRETSSGPAARRHAASPPAVRRRKLLLPAAGLSFAWAAMLNTDLVPATDGSHDRLLVLLHGLGDSMEGWRFFPEEAGLPWLNTLLVEAPDPYYGGYAWYDFFGDQAQGINRSRLALHELLDSLPARGFRHDRTVLMGFSQGCVMTLEAGLRYPHRLAGLVGLSGYVFGIERLLPELPPVAREQRVLVTHGTRDPLLPIEISRDQVQKLKAAGLDVTWQEFNKEHTLDTIRELGVLRDFITRTLTP